MNFDSGTPTPDFGAMGEISTEVDDDVDPELDAKLDELANKSEEDFEDARRRSRSFFDQTDVSSGLKSVLPPQVTSGNGNLRKDSMGGEVKLVERTGKLKMTELVVLQQGLTDAHNITGLVKADRRDSDLDVDKEEEKRKEIMSMVRDMQSRGGLAPRLVVGGGGGNDIQEGGEKLR